MDNFEYKQIFEKIKTIRNKGTVYTNFLPLMGEDSKKSYRATFTENTVVFLKKEGCVDKLIFCSNNKDELITHLRETFANVSIDVFSREKTIDDDYICNSGFQKSGILQRISFPDINMDEETVMKDENLRKLYACRDENIGRFAEPGEESEIFNLLERTFDLHVDHIPSEEEIFNYYIPNKKILLHCENGKIVTLISFDVIGKKLFLFSVLNLSDYKKLCALELKLRDIIKVQDIHYMYTYVDIYNEHAVKYHKRRLAKFEAFYNHVYVKG